jgi:hypothetical protein
MCGGCGGKVRTLRVQRVERSQRAKKSDVNISKITKYHINKQTQKPAAIKRQALVRNDKCPKCQHTIMLVNIAGRERKQCTNTSCKFVIK